jgi:hypothetical protein
MSGCHINADRLTASMPCHPHHFTRPSAAMPGTPSALLGEVPERGAVV